jgi:FkbM family methyltransferase
MRIGDLSKLFSYLTRYVRALGFRQGLAAFDAMYLRRRGLCAIPRGTGKIWLRDDSADRYVYRSVFIDRDYDTSVEHCWGQDPQMRRRYEAILTAGCVPVIIDAGAHIGLASVWFSEQYPQAKIYAVEPDDGNLSVLTRNAIGRAITPLAGAVWDKAARLRIVNADAASHSFRVIEGEGDLRAYSIPEIAGMEPRGQLFIVKVDIEGGEKVLFRSNAAWMESPALIIVEPHDWLYPGEGVTRTFLQRIAELPIEILIRGDSLFCFAAGGPSTGR